MTFKNAEKEIRRCKENLSALISNSHRNINWGEVKSIHKQIDELWKQEEIYWGQRSWIKWLNWGDRNSTFFHASTIQRRERNRLVRVKNSEGEWIEGHDTVMAEIHRHFSEVYKADDYTGNYEMLEVILSLVSAEMNEILVVGVSEVDIRGAVFSLGANKAPGPDGFNGMFFQKNWDSVKTRLCEAIQEFFNNGILPQTSMRLWWPWYLKSFCPRVSTSCAL